MLAIWMLYVVYIIFEMGKESRMSWKGLEKDKD